MTTQALPYDDTPTGHSYAAFWTATIGFSVLSALLVIAGFQWAAMNHFFG